LDSREFMEVHIWPRLSHELIFKNLSGLVKTRTGIAADCPNCGTRGTFFAVDGRRYGACNRRNKCNYLTYWWNHIKESYGLSRQEVFFFLADMAGVEVPGRSGRSVIKTRNQYEVREMIVRFGRNNLMSNRPGAVKMRECLLGRGFTLGELQETEFMYIEREHMMKFLFSRGLDRKLIKHSGILTQKFGEQYRLIFPFRTGKGRIEGFVGRLNPEDETCGGRLSKYKNSFGLTKSAPFNFHDAYREDVKTMMVVEGPIDVYLMKAKKFEGASVVAFLGDYPTREAAGMITGSKHNFILLALDDDEAGRRATMKLLTELSSDEKRIFVARGFQGFKDPGEMIAAKGMEAFSEFIRKESVSASYWALIQTISGIRDSGAYGKVVGLSKLAHIYRKASEEEKKEFIDTATAETLLHPDDIKAAVGEEVNNYGKI